MNSNKYVVTGILGLIFVQLFLVIAQAQFVNQTGQNLNSTVNNSAVNNTNNTHQLNILPQPNLNFTANATSSPANTTVAQTNTTAPSVNTTVANQTPQVNIPPITAVSVSVPSTSVSGQQTPMTAVVSGGSGPYTYSWFEVVPGTTDPVSIASCTGSGQSNTCAFNTTPATPSGRYSIYVTVGDPAGQTVTSNTAGVLVFP